MDRHGFLELLGQVRIVQRAARVAADFGRGRIREETELVAAVDGAHPVFELPLSVESADVSRVGIGSPNRKQEMTVEDKRTKKK